MREKKKNPEAGDTTVISETYETRRDGALEIKSLCDARSLFPKRRPVFSAGDRTDLAAGLINRAVSWRMAIRFPDADAWQCGTAACQSTPALDRLAQPSTVRSTRIRLRASGATKSIVDSAAVRH
ncbi:unnamed protein product, partial [Iphiclides podalirius]